MGNKWLHSAIGFPPKAFLSPPLNTIERRLLRGFCLLDITYIFYHGGGGRYIIEFQMNTEGIVLVVSQSVTHSVSGFNKWSAMTIHSGLAGGW